MHVFWGVGGPVFGMLYATLLHDLLWLIAAHELPNNCETVEKHIFELNYILQKKGRDKTFKKPYEVFGGFLACEIR